MEKYNVEYFIRKFNKIPNKLFTTQKFQDGNKYCAQGHCGILSWSDICNAREGEGSKEAVALMNLSDHLLEEGQNLDEYSPIGRINNGDHSDYRQSTPKRRVLAALNDIKAKQEAKSIKERIVYVTVDEKVRQIQKEELILN